MRAIFVSLGLLALALPVVAGDLSAFQAQMLSDARPHLPVKVDAMVTLDAVSFTGTRIVYHYSVADTLHVDMADYQAARFDSFCDALEGMYTPGELTAIGHEYGFIDGTKASVGVSMDECTATSDAERKAFFDFARQMSGQ